MSLKGSGVVRGNVHSIICKNTICLSFLSILSENIESLKSVDIIKLMTDSENTSLLDDFEASSRNYYAKLFLSSVMDTRLEKRDKRNPKAALFDNRGHSRFINNRALLKTKYTNLLGAMSCMTTSQSEKISGTMSSYMKVALGINLFLDSNGGLSGECSKNISNTGISASESTVRSQVRHLSENVHLENIMDPPPKGYNYIVGLTLDNADFRLYAKNVSLIAAGRVCLGLEKEEDTKAINDHFLAGPNPQTRFYNRYFQPKRKIDMQKISCLTKHLVLCCHV